MKTGNRTVDRNLGRAEARWRKLRFAELAGVTGSLVCLFFLLLALPMGAGWITDPSGAKALIVVAIVFALLALLGSAIFVIERDLDPRWLARVLESGSPDLLDRVNTLIALKQDTRSARAGSIAYRVGPAKRSHRREFGSPARKGAGSRHVKRALPRDTGGYGLRGRALTIRPSRRRFAARLNSGVRPRWNSTAVVASAGVSGALLQVAQVGHGAGD